VAEDRVGRATTRRGVGPPFPAVSTQLAAA